MSDQEAAQGFTDKWLAQWPEWVVAEVFVPADQRDLARAWFSLREELTEAAWGGEDPLPGQAKLGWWVEELGGWSRGAHRHPLGRVLQPKPVSWDNLAAALPALRASRERPKDLDAALCSLEPYAEALAGVAQRLFNSQTPAPSRSVVISLLAERLLRYPGDATPLGDLDARSWAEKLLLQWPPPGQGSCAGRIHAALVRGRLQRFAAGKSPVLPRLSALANAWRAARA